MSLESTGEMSLEEADDMNIPVNSHLVAPDDDSPKWRWFADNFMPRRGSVAQGQYEIEADTKEEILALVNEHVVPLYEAALSNLKLRGENYYWEMK